MTKKEFKTFKKYVRKWLAILGLTDWEVSVQFGKVSEDTACQTLSENQNRLALIRIDEETENASNKNLELIAIHECLELVMADIRDALCSFYNADLVDKNIHRVIRRLENVLK